MYLYMIKSDQNIMIRFSPMIGSFYQMFTLQILTNTLDGFAIIWPIFETKNVVRYGLWKSVLLK